MPDLEFVSDVSQCAINPGKDLDRFHAAADNSSVYSAPIFNNNSLSAFTGSNGTNIPRRGLLRRGPLRREPLKMRPVI
jgi:hypothetical protein